MQLATLDRLGCVLREHSRMGFVLTFLSIDVNNSSTKILQMRMIACCCYADAVRSEVLLPTKAAADLV